MKINYYDPYDYHSFVDASETIITLQPDGVMVAPTAPQYTKGFTDQLHTLDIPYIYIDSNIKDVPPLAFFGQNSRQSGYFAARMLMLLSRLLLYPAVFFLGAGIFLGAVWANASWGRYWAWDPKEVWALITFMVYGAAFHARSLRIFRSPLFFHIYMIVAFLTVLMTYFGVNYILGGMHSYANA